MTDPRSYAIHQAINDVIVDHPMWIDNNAGPLPYLPEREARIAEFVDEATRNVTVALAALDGPRCGCAGPTSHAYRGANHA
jgi:hypothetical protein